MKQKIIIFSAFVLLMFTGCKTMKSVTKTQLKGDSEVAQVIKQVQKAQPEFISANVNKMSFEFTMNERKVNVSASCKIQKDSAIYISIQPFMGIELFKAELTPDSILVFDKMNRRYYVTDYGYFKKRFGVDVDFHNLQALIFNQFFCIGTKEILPDSCKLTTLDAGKNKIEYQNAGIQQSTVILPIHTIQQVLLKGENSSYQLQTDYDEYSVVNDINFPMKIAMIASNQKNKASCVFSILKVEFNTKLKFIATERNRYTRGDIDQILKK
jgi:hypothetical protein